MVMWYSVNQVSFLNVQGSSWNPWNYAQDTRKTQEGKKIGRQSGFLIQCWYPFCAYGTGHVSLRLSAVTTLEAVWGD